MVNGFLVGALLGFVYVWRSADNWNAFWYNVGAAASLFGLAGAAIGALLARGGY